MNARAGYTGTPHSRVRRAALRLDLALLQRRHFVHTLLYANVTSPRSHINARLRQTGERLSFTAFVIACVAYAVDGDKIMHAYRKARRHLVLYEDVDMATVLDRDLDDQHRQHRQHQAVFHIVRAANRTSLHELHTEVRTTQAQPAL